MSDASDDHRAVGIVDCKDDAMIADPDPVVVPPGELDDATRSRIGCKPVDRAPNSISNRALEPAILAHGCRREPDLVKRLRLVSYSLTSAHATVASRSSRACSAARLSSR